MQMMLVDVSQICMAACLVMYEKPRPQEGAKKSLGVNSRQLGHGANEL